MQSDVGPSAGANRPETNANPLLSRREIPSLPETNSGLRNVPAWVVSLCLHFAIITAFSVFWVAKPRGTGADPDRPVGIAVVYETSGGEEYYLGDGTSGESSASDSPSSELPELSESSFAAESASLLESVSPGATNAGSAASQAAGGLGLGDGGAQLGRGTGIPKAKTSVFGIEGEGTRFVYVFDRSASMNGQEGRPLRAAKSEMLGSIQSLGPTHQFQIVFYNDNPLPFGGMIGGAPSLFSGEENAKNKAERFIRGVTATGGTRHLDALLLAFAMGPDVVFFLTDADRPGLPKRTVEDLKVRAARAGATVHCIQFGTGPNQLGGGWIKSLAEGTLGKYRYVDVLSLANSGKDSGLP